ncbi:MAG: EI24 domain-containing protein [Pseudomonadota bacterium]|nr:EI24 domain-containing protein [Pseudomonadota bacterium]
MTSLVSLFSSGFAAPLKGIVFIFKNPSLWIWALLPFFLNAVLVVVSFSWAFQNLADMVFSVLAFLGFSVHSGVFAWMLFYFFKILLWIIFFIFLSFVAYLFGQIISSPFSAVLSEKSLIKLNVIKDRPFLLKIWLATSIKMMRISLVKGVLFLLIGVVLFFAGMIPVINILVPFAVLLTIAFDSADYSFENLHMTLRERLAFFRKNFSIFAGYSMALGIVLFVPGLNFFLFPASVVGSSLLIAQIKDPPEDAPNVKS